MDRTVSTSMDVEIITVDSDSDNEIIASHQFLKPQTRDDDDDITIVYVKAPPANVSKPEPELPLELGLVDAYSQQPKLESVDEGDVALPMAPPINLQSIGEESAALIQRIDELRRSTAILSKLLADNGGSVLKDGGRRVEEQLQAELVTLGEQENDLFRHISTVSKEKKPFDASISGAIMANLQSIASIRPIDVEYVETPRGLTVNLLVHQMRALAFMRWRESQQPAGGILADEMGLGKTLTVISLILLTSEHIINEPELARVDSMAYYDDDADRPNTLIVCPASLLAQWQQEIQNYTLEGHLRVLVFHGPNRPRSVREVKCFDVVITTYNLVAMHEKCDSGVGHRCPLQPIYWRRIVLDEGHIIRNSETAVFKQVSKLEDDKRWIVTGTPIQNKAEDVISLICFLRYRPFDQMDVWEGLLNHFESSNRVHSMIATILRNIIIRRTKSQLVAAQLMPPMPEKVIRIFYVNMNDEERAIYGQLEAWSQSLLSEYLRLRDDQMTRAETSLRSNDLPSTSRSTPIITCAVLRFLAKAKELSKNKRHLIICILVLILRLRQACCHPALVHGMFDELMLEEVDIDDNKSINPDCLRNEIQRLFNSDNPELSNLSAFDAEVPTVKINFIVAKVKEILDIGDKLIIVSQWTMYLDLIAKHLKKKSIECFVKFTGSQSTRERAEIIRIFNNRDEPPHIMLLSLTAGGVGLNLTTANHMIFADIHWNPQLELQCADRIHRIGQTKTCHIYKILCNRCIESRVLELQASKLAIANEILNSEGSDFQGSRLSLADIQKLFGM